MSRVRKSKDPRDYSTSWTLENRVCIAGCGVQGAGDVEKNRGIRCLLRGKRFRYLRAKLFSSGIFLVSVCRELWTSEILRRLYVLFSRNRKMPGSGIPFAS